MTPVSDVNAVVGGLLRDLAFAQTAQPKMFGYKRAAVAVLALDTALTELITPEGGLPRIAGIGPGSARIIQETLETGGSPTVEHAIDVSGRRGDIERRRALRAHFLSRAEVLRVLRDRSTGGPTLADYAGDLQMHSEWSDGSPTVEDITRACQARGYAYAAVTDHSHGLKIAGGMSMQEAAEQRHAIDRLNARSHSFRLLQGIEANIGADGQLDLSPTRRASSNLYSPHRTHGFGAARIRQNDSSSPFRTRPSESSPTRAGASPDRARESSPIGKGCCRRGGFRCRRRNRWRSRPAGPGLRARGIGTRRRLSLRPRQPCAYHRATFVRGDRDRTCEAREHRGRSDRDHWPLDRLVDWLSDPQREARTFVQHQERAW